MQIKGSALSDTGKKRPINEDSVGFFQAEKLFVVSDGMGGHAAGKTASDIAISSIRKFWTDQVQDNETAPAINSSPSFTPMPRKLQAAIQFANKQIFEAAQNNQDYQGMGATVVVLSLEDNRAYICHVGDSRAYLVRDEAIKQLTDDHSLVSELVKRNELTPEEAKTYPHRNVITRALGRKEVLADITIEPCCHEDSFVLCTDGLTNMVEDGEILQAVLEHRDEPQTACQHLIDLANQRGGSDNITVIILSVSLES